MPKSYRIRTEIGVDKYINLNLEQDWESLEILSLKILSNNIYTRFCADYGVVIGRVFVNGGFGLPNAKVSVFIPLEDDDELNPVISELYPYKSITDINEQGYRYNLLPKIPSYQGHVSTGSFPNKADVLMDESYIEVYDKYYRFTVTTNESGDFMIFGVPVGEQTIVMDVDLSDIGCFSFSPQDLIQQGLATESQVNGARFKSSTNLQELPQIKNLIFDVNVRPFWGSNDLCQIGITRVDFDLSKQANVRIQPNAIFIGSIISTTDDDSLKTTCRPKNNTGNLCELVAGPGLIESIRQTIFADINGLPILERFNLEEGGKVIDSDGTYVINVPMNLDYISTNESGQQFLTNDPNKGIPTKGKYRFKFKWQNEQGLQNSFLKADFLVPNIKEYGWDNFTNDPTNLTTTQFSYNIPIGSFSGTPIAVYPPGGLINPITTNVESYVVFINDNEYFGSVESIEINPGDFLSIVATPININEPQVFQFTIVPQELFETLKSYAFSTDWEDYNDIQSGINCEDTFYEFKYNKVYTTAMFLDRYKNGIGRARHLGIKEIDNRSCKSTVNTFPVNDIIRNFDAIFFIFNLLINLLTFPILTLLFVAHLIAFMWPILKYVMIALAIYLTYDAAVSLVESVQAGIRVINSAAGVINIGFVSVNVGMILMGISDLLYGAYLILVAAFKLALSLAFLAFTIIAAIRIKGFPRIGLPMISYPDCTSCDCQCGNATIEDDFSYTSVLNDVNEAASEQATGEFNVILSTPKTLIAPVNYSGSYNLNHPNLGPNEDNEDPYNCETLAGLLTAPAEVTIDVVVKASTDFKKIFSGYDVISSTDPNRLLDNESYLLKAPQPFLFTANRNFFFPDTRDFAVPLDVPYGQKLNEFNTRDKYFYSDTSDTPSSGPNRIKTRVNQDLGSDSYDDQVLVVLMAQGATQQLGVGTIVTFQDPKYVDSSFPISRLVNLTGATLNQFNTTSITGNTTTGETIPITISYANPSNPTAQLTSNIFIVSPQVSQLPVDGNSSVEQSYLQYPTDIEYFQLVTGVTYNDFIALSNTSATNLFPQRYLLHDIRVNVGWCGVNVLTYNNIIENMQGYNYYEICIFVRGVDPHSPKQPNITYDLSRIFGKTFGTGPIVSGSYYLNYPIQSLTTGVKPKEHDTPSNISQNLYFPSFTFTPSSSYSGFTSNYPYYYLSTDDIISSSYSPYPGQWAIVSNTTISQQETTTVYNNIPWFNNPISQYMVGGTYIRYINPLTTDMRLNTNQAGDDCNSDCQKGRYFNTDDFFYLQPTNNNGNLSATYSPAYYRYNLNGVEFSSSNNIVMRSDRLPTSTDVQNGASGTNTGFALHQNDNFGFFNADGLQSEPIITAGLDIPSGEHQDSNEIISGLTNTLTCDGMVPLSCYSGSGSSVGVIPAEDCSVPADRMINGCYCILNRRYVAQYSDDVRLFLEWKVRFTMNFAACRGIFAQVFQNNWINGTLYMFSFNKTTTFPSDGPPSYNYCKDVIIFNQISNTFFYRSSPYNGNGFIGKEAPGENSSNTIIKPGYNERQIQFPTTVVDLGPRDYFIKDICCATGEEKFGSYYVEQLKTTSYQDNSDIIQLGFLSRILNEGVRQRIIPITTGGNNTEGKGIIQFFNSTRGGDRIDGDYAQMLSINSEWKILPFISENVTLQEQIYFGDNRNDASSSSIQSINIKPIMGLFFEVTQQDVSYRKIMSPGIEVFNFNPLIQDYFGYPKSQEVPNYKWNISLPSIYAGNPNIFGSENNNWTTKPIGSLYFLSKKYQDLDFESASEKYRTSTTQLGYLTNFNNNGVPSPYVNPLTNILQGAPAEDSVVNQYSIIIVGAPYHFYFGLNNGKTAIDRFFKLYVATEE